MVDSFNEQFDKLVEVFNGEEGLVWMQQEKLIYFVNSLFYQEVVQVVLKQVLESIGVFYSQVNDSMLNVQ